MDYQIREAIERLKENMATIPEHLQEDLHLLFKTIENQKEQEVYSYPIHTERKGDMGEGRKLSLFREDDGDIIIGVIPENHRVVLEGVQFCTPFVGGGKSPHTFEALKQLMVAMEKDQQ